MSKLPPGYEEASCQLHSYSMAGEFLKDFCRDCAKKECDINNALRMAMGENYPFGHEALIIVRSTDYGQYGTRMICTEYESPQLRLFEGKEWPSILSKKEEPSSIDFIIEPLPDGFQDEEELEEI